MFDRAFRTLAHVPRWAILRVNRRQSVAEHSFFVATYAFEIADAIRWNGDRGALLAYALAHDGAEIVKGDPPSPYHQQIKTDEAEAWVEQKMRERLRASSIYWHNGVGDEAKAIVKLADIVEAILYLCDERAQGNRNTKPMEDYMAGQLTHHWFKVFLPLFQLDNAMLAPAGHLWSAILEAIGDAGNGHDPVVA